MFRFSSIKDRIFKPFPVGRRPPQSGIDLYHFRRKKGYNSTYLLLGESKWASVLPFLAALTLFISIRDELRSGLEHRIEQGMPVSKLSSQLEPRAPEQGL